MASYVPQLDFSILGNLPDVYAARQENERANLFAQGVAGLPRNANGEIDMNAAIQLAARTGNIRSLRDLIATQGIYSEQQAMRDAAGFGNLFGGVGQQPQQPPPQPPSQNMIPGNRAPILDATGFRTTQASPEADVPVGTERPMQAAAASSGAASASGLPYDYGSATFTSEPKTRLAYGADGTTASDALPPVFNKTRIAQAGGGIPTAQGDLYSEPVAGARPVQTVPIKPAAPATTGARTPQQQPIIPSLSDPSMVPRVMAALRSRKLPEGQRQAAMLYLKNVFESDNPTQEMRNIQFLQQNPHLKEMFLELKRASSTQINTVEGMEAAQTKARLDVDKDRAKEMAKVVDRGSEALATLNHIQRIADQTPGGWAGSVAPTLARGLSALGIGVTEGMSNAEVMAAITRTLIPSIREPGATSNYENQLFMSAVPGLMQSVEGRKKMAEFNKRVIQHKQELLKTMRANMGKEDLDDKLMAVSQKRLFTDDEYGLMEEAARGAGANLPERPSDPRQRGGLPRPKTRAEFEALKSGDRFIDPNGDERIK